MTIKYSFLIDMYRLRETLPKNTLQLIALNLFKLAQINIESIHVESQKSNPNIEQIDICAYELFFVYRTCLGLFDQIISFTEQQSNIEKYHVPLEHKIKNVQELYDEIKYILERFLEVRT